MKHFKFLTALAILSFFVSCNDDETIQDPVYEFISFQTPALTVNENGASIKASPIVLKLNGYVLKEDITVNLKVTENNTTEGADYTLSSKSIIFKKGKFISDTLFVSTIDNAAGSLVERSFDIKIESISNPSIKIGFGIENPKNSSLKVLIADDECSKTTNVFNSTNLTNTRSTGSVRTISGSLSGNTLSLVGDLAFYGAFPGAKLNVTLTPASAGATKGKATFSDFDAGTDNDGYVYQLRPVGEGTYDVCSGKINITYTVYYMDGGAWVYWKKCICVITVP